MTAIALVDVIGTTGALPLPVWLTAAAVLPPPQAPSRLVSRTINRERQRTLLKKVIDIDAVRNKLGRVGIAKKTAHPTI